MFLIVKNRKLKMGSCRKLKAELKMAFHMCLVFKLKRDELSKTESWLFQVACNSLKLNSFTFLTIFGPFSPEKPPRMRASVFSFPHIF